MIHRKTIHGTKKDAEVELAKFVTEVQNGLVIDGKSLKFSEQHLISMYTLLFLIIEMQEMYYKTCYYKKTSLKSFFKFH